MSHITAEEWQLLSFFAVEPTLLDADGVWCYNHAVYRVRQGPLVLVFAIDPAYRDVQIILEYENAKLYEFKAECVKDVRYAVQGGVEQLEIEVNDRESLVLRVAPRIDVHHKYDGLR